jgi:hypothetical protein
VAKAHHYEGNLDTENFGWPAALLEFISFAARIRRTTGELITMRKFRERGIYLAPDGRSFVASKMRRPSTNGTKALSRNDSEISFFLFDRYQWAFHGAPDFEIAADGRVVSAHPTSWDIHHLIDTDTTAGEH